ncbi:hypothetical protein CPB86DRAFT_830805 [Serendipita vermifera]|nr:hypothetical protein CPB86DRAFT_830805 [Serendipita vermifera]
MLTKSHDENPPTTDVASIATPLFMLYYYLVAFFYIFVLLLSCTNPFLLIWFLSKKPQPPNGEIENVSGLYGPGAYWAWVLCTISAILSSAVEDNPQSMISADHIVSFLYSMSSTYWYYIRVAWYGLEGPALLQDHSVQAAAFTLHTSSLLYALGAIFSTRGKKGPWIIFAVWDCWLLWISPMLTVDLGSKLVTVIALPILFIFLACRHDIPVETLETLKGRSTIEEVLIPSPDYIVILSLTAIMLASIAARVLVPILFFFYILMFGLSWTNPFLLIWFFGKQSQPPNGEVENVSGLYGPGAYWAWVLCTISAILSSTMEDHFIISADHLISFLYSTVSVYWYYIRVAWYGLRGHALLQDHSVQAAAFTLHISSLLHALGAIFSSRDKNGPWILFVAWDCWLLWISPMLTVTLGICKFRVPNTSRISHRHGHSFRANYR